MHDEGYKDSLKMSLVCIRARTQHKQLIIGAIAIGIPLLSVIFISNARQNDNRRVANRAQRLIAAPPLDGRPWYALDGARCGRARSPTLVLYRRTSPLSTMPDARYDPAQENGLPPTVLPDIKADRQRARAERVFAAHARNRGCQSSNRAEPRSKRRQIISTAAWTRACPRARARGRRPVLPRHRAC